MNEMEFPCQKKNENEKNEEKTKKKQTWKTFIQLLNLQILRVIEDKQIFIDKF